jgi:hypothetical protein
LPNESTGLKLELFPSTPRGTLVADRSVVKSGEKLGVLTSPSPDSTMFDVVGNGRAGEEIDLAFVHGSLLADALGLNHNSPAMRETF